jgi:hypothetical protein
MPARRALRRRVDAAVRAAAGLGLDVHHSSGLCWAVKRP